MPQFRPSLQTAADHENRVRLFEDYRLELLWGITQLMKICFSLLKYMVWNFPGDLQN
jgi:hypothetical protein